MFTQVSVPGALRKTGKSKEVSSVGRHPGGTLRAFQILLESFPRSNVRRGDGTRAGVPLVARGPGAGGGAEAGGGGAGGGEADGGGTDSWWSPRRHGRRSGDACGPLSGMGRVSERVWRQGPFARTGEALRLQRQTLAGRAPPLEALRATLQAGKDLARSARALVLGRRPAGVAPGVGPEWVCARGSRSRSNGGRVPRPRR